VGIIDVRQRRARLALRHRLAPSSIGATPEDAADAVVALHATDPATVFLSVRARTADVDVTRIEQALYEDRTLIRMLGMRRTMFVVPTGVAPEIQAGCTRAIAATQRQRYTKLVVEAGVGDGAWLAELEEGAARALLARGSATGAQLSQDEPRLRTPITLAEGKSYGSTANVTSWVLLLLAADGRIMRGRPRGSWTSTQWTWAPTEAWLPDGMPDLTAEAARAELARRWLRAFGPATAADLRWWTGWTGAQVKQALAVVRPAEVDLDGVPGLALPDDLAPVAEPAPWVALLPALDPTPMGWSNRSWYLGAHAPQLFDRSGNVGPTVWSDGRIIGGWAQRSDGEVVFRLLEDVGREVATAVEAEAGRLESWIGRARVTPRFRTPLERELTA
jgi:hypothetical protein